MHERALDKLRQLLAQDAERLDESTRVRLAAARAAALRHRRDRVTAWRLALPMGLATALILFLWLDPMQPNSTVTHPEMDDMEILLSGDEMDLLENLDFYAWLQSDTPSG